MSSASCSHRKDLRYFNCTSAANWSLLGYLNYKHHPRQSPANIASRWVTSLTQIARCKRGCPKQDCERAASLLCQYNKPDKTERNYMQEWLRKQTESPRPTTTVTATNVGALFMNSPLENSVSNVSGRPADIRDGHNAPTEDNTLAEHDVLTPTEADTPVRQDPSAEEDPPAEEDTLKEDGILPAEWESTYQGFADDRKLRLKSGRAVEDVFHDNCSGLLLGSSFSMLARGWIIALDNNTMRSWFKPSEWQEINALVPQLPSADESFVKSLTRFNSVKTVEGLRNVLDTTSYRPQGTSYDQELHFDAAWADTVIRSFLLLFGAQEQPLCNSHLEGWYASRIWSPIIDQCFLSLPYMTFERGESTCQATSLRKNRDRSERKDRAKSGSRIDGILRSIEDDPLEYFVMEVSRTFQGGMTSTKLLDDNHRLVRSLRDMLGLLVQRGGKQVVGAIGSGRSLKFCRLVHIGGYMCVLKWEATRTVPSSVGQFQDLLFLLNSVVRHKGIVKACLEAVKGRRSVQPEELEDRLMNDRAVSPVMDLPWPVKSPSRR